MNTQALFAICQASDSLPVQDVHGAACDNAAATLGSKFAQGNFDDAFLSNWIGSIQDILSTAEGANTEAREFFSAHGVAA